MSLILAGLVFAGTSGALMIGRWIARRRGEAVADGDKAAEPKEDDEEKTARKEVEAEVPASAEVNEDEGDGSKKEPAAKPKEPPKRETRRKPITAATTDRLEGFVCQLGDVVMRITGEEAWLAGGVVLAEEVPVAVLFVAPDAGGDCVIYVRPRSRSRGSLAWLTPLDPSAILVGGEPPSSVEHGGVRFDRARRLPLRPRRIGVGAPDTGDAVIVAEYESAGAERLLVLKANSGSVYAYRGLELEEGSFEVIASGATTLE